MAVLQSPREGITPRHNLMRYYAGAESKTYSLAGRVHEKETIRLGFGISLFRYCETTRTSYPLNSP